MTIGVIERPAEFRMMTDFLQAAGRKPSALVIGGEAGIGKTTLWLAVEAEARRLGFRVLTARVGQAETELAYTAVADLLGNVEPAILAELPEVQRVAVDRVLLRAVSEGPPTDQGVVAAAFASVIDRLAADTPVLLAIDDVQWLDASSQAVLATTARRLTGQVGLLLTERSEQHGIDAASWLQLSEPDGTFRMRLGPLSLGGLHVLISSRLGRSLARPTLVRIAEVSGGNPFFALELARAIDAGTTNSSQVLPATLAELMRLRIGRLACDTQKLLLAAACAAAPTVELIAAATCTSVDSATKHLDEAIIKGIIAIEEGTVRFAHPLLARSVYTDASPAERRAMHRALADLATQPESKARHMALAASSADPATLKALDEAADAAIVRGAPAAAAELMELAMAIGGDEPERRLRAAQHHFSAGDPERARSILQRTMDLLPTGPLRAMALNLMAGCNLYSDDWSAAVECLKHALDDAEESPPLLTQTLIVLAFAQRMVSQFDESLFNARKAVTYAERVGEPGLLSRALAMSVQLNFVYGNGIDDRSLRRALQLEDPDALGLLPFRASMVEALLLSWTGKLDEARTKMQMLERQCTERGAEYDLMGLAGCRTFTEVWRGDLAEAARVAEEAVQRAEQSSGSLAVALSMRALVASYQGREEDTHRDVAVALDIATRSLSPRLTEWPAMITGFLEVSLGNYTRALVALEPMQQSLQAIPGTEILTAGFIPDAVEALCALGRCEEAEPMIEALETNGRQWDRPWMLAVGARCRSMWLAATGDVATATWMAEDAMAHHDRLPMPFERARTLLLLGQLQRRQRKKESARATLTEAMETFKAIGTPLWAERARAELSRASAAPRKELGLTASEQRVAELAASGMTTRDVAAALFISPKTVETNLARIYRKFGIKSRAELGRVFGE